MPGRPAGVGDAAMSAASIAGTVAGRSGWPSVPGYGFDSRHRSNVVSSTSARTRAGGPPAPGGTCEGPKRHERDDRPDEQQVDADIGLGGPHQDQPLPGRIGKPQDGRHPENIGSRHHPEHRCAAKSPQREVERRDQENVPRLLDEPLAKCLQHYLRRTLWRRGDAGPRPRAPLAPGRGEALPQIRVRRNTQITRPKSRPPGSGSARSR